MLRLTKTDMARVIITALYNLPALAAADNPRVIALTRRKAAYLAIQHKRACAILNARREG